MSLSNPIQIYPQEEFLVINSVRYARGRATYAVSETCEWVAEHWDQLSENTKTVIARDVRQEVESRRNEGDRQSAFEQIDNLFWERLFEVVGDWA